MPASQDVRTSGAVLSTNAVIKVPVGFKPTLVWCLNKANVTEMKWVGGMPDDSALRRSGNANPSYITSSGISPYDDGTNQGFQIGPDSQMNPTGNNEIFWSVIRGNDPA